MNGRFRPYHAEWEKVGNAVGLVSGGRISNKVENFSRLFSTAVSRIGEI
jgi:hypothetical protein